jgi:phosphoribosylglycinamide formyltransferase-1
MTAPGPLRLVCLISGGGRTVLNLQDAIDRGDLDARIDLVIASRPCPGIDRCAARGLAVRLIPGDLDAGTLADALGDANLACLSGYLRLVPVPAGWEGRILNIHPALLPAFGGPGMYGDRVHRAVLDAARRGQITETGCTVHVCDARYDTGPIIVQRRCPVLPGDTVESLAARVFTEECAAYPEAIRRVADTLDRRRGQAREQERSP